MSAIVAAIARALGISPGASARLLVWIVAGSLLVAAGGLHAWMATNAREEAVAAAHAAGMAAGEASERVRWQTAAAEERRRQDTANAEAASAAEKVVAALRRERDDLSQALEDLTHEADADPSGARECLDARSVRALDALRR